MANEPGSGNPRSDKYFKEIYDFTKVLDSTRPITVVSCTGRWTGGTSECHAMKHYDLLTINRYFGWYIGGNRLEEDMLEEERRLAYVGITRAQKTLTFSYAVRRKRQGELVECEPSRFLHELPQDDLAWEGSTEPDPEQRQQRGQAHLANLRGILGGAG